jgi:two-component system, LytTR family, response regulator
MNPERIRTLIVDDEMLARNKIARYLKEMPGVEIVDECSNGLEAVQSILKNQPDLVFLDIQMPELDGFGVIRTIGVQQMPMVIFVTAFDQYAIQAFENQAIDYLLKPFNAQRFVAAVERAIQMIQHHSQDDYEERLQDLLERLREKSTYIERITIKTSNRLYFIKVDEIEWIDAAGNYVDIHIGDETHLLRETMNNLEAKLNPSRFLRIHRSTIVNIDRIKEMQPDVNNDYIVIMKTGKQLIMSRRNREKLNKIIGLYL